MSNWLKAKSVRWFALGLFLFSASAFAYESAKRWRAHKIVAVAGLPRLPSSAKIKYSRIETHDLSFKEVALGFTASASQLDEWIESAEGFDETRSGAQPAVLGFSIRRWSIRPGIDFSATLSYK